MKKIIYILPFFLLICCKSQKSATASIDSRSLYEEQREKLFKYYFYEAEKAIHLSEFDRAMGLWLFCQSLDSTDAAVQQNLGFLYQGLENKEAAHKHYQRAYELDKRMYWKNYVSLLFDENEYEEAASVLTEIQKLLPDDTEVLEALSTAYQAKGDQKSAIKTQLKLQKTEGINEYNTMALYNLYSSTGQVSKAVKVVEDYVDENPDDTRFIAFLLDIYCSYDSTKAQNYQLEQLQKHPADPYILLSLSHYAFIRGDDQIGTEYMRQAFQSSEWGFADKMSQLDLIQRRYNFNVPLTVMIYDQLIKDYPMEAFVYRRYSDFLLLLGDYQAAKPVVRSLLEIDESTSEDWMTYLQILQSDTISTDAEYEWCIFNAFHKFPHSVEWSYWYSRLAIINQQIDFALVVAERAIHYNKDKDLTQEEKNYLFHLHQLCGDIYSSRDEYDKSFEHYEGALLIDPNNSYILNNYAYLLALHGDNISKAENMSQKTLQNEPNNAMYLDTYAWILHLQGQDMLARFYIQKAIENLKDEPEEEIRQHYNIIMNK